MITPPGKTRATAQSGPATARAAGASPVRVRIWDLPTRLFHWSLVACIVGSLVSINFGGNAVGWHFRFGYAILTLLLFRLIWGFVGPVHARFASFPPNPAAALRYLKGDHPHRGGHNPLGAFSVYALLLALTVQVSTGLFANDAIMWDGPLRKLVSNSTSNTLTGIHQINRIVVISLVILHIGAVLWYRIARREPLIEPMIVGDRPYPADQGATIPAAQDDASMRVRGLAVLVVCAAIVWAIVEVLPG